MSDLAALTLGWVEFVALLGLLGWFLLWRQS